VEEKLMEHYHCQRPYLLELMDNHKHHFLHLNHHHRLVNMLHLVLNLLDHRLLKLLNQKLKQILFPHQNQLDHLVILLLQHLL
tara:strand:- start:52 stop:300 length:249 start_codon:yes stop_codon:yes gene_type:complete